MVTRRTSTLAALAIVVVLLAPGCGRDQPAVVGTTTIAAAERDEPLGLVGTTLDGGAFDLADLRGSVVVLNSWASWCAPCRDETPDLVALAGDADPADVQVVGLNVTDDAEAAQAFVEEFGVPYPIVVDPDGALLRTIPGVPPASLPSTVVLDREGRIAARIVGVTDADELAGLIADVLQESPESASALVSAG